MSAPAGLAVSKIIYPEVEVPETEKLSRMKQNENRLDALCVCQYILLCIYIDIYMIRLGEPNVQLHFCILECVHIHLTVNRSPLCIILFSRETANVIDAAARGATDAIFVVFAVVASLISFLSLLHFINAVINYLGELVDINDLSLDASIKKHCTFSQNRT